MDMFLVPNAYTHMCVYRRLLTPSGNMLDTDQQTGSVVITARQDKSEFCDICLECELVVVDDWIRETMKEMGIRFVRYLFW